jgi:hypothetical protein
MFLNDNTASFPRRCSWAGTPRGEWPRDRMARAVSAGAPRASPPTTQQRRVGVAVRGAHGAAAAARLLLPWTTAEGGRVVLDVLPLMRKATLDAFEAGHCFDCTKSLAGDEIAGGVRAPHSSFSSTRCRCASERAGGFLVVVAARLLLLLLLLMLLLSPGSCTTTTPPGTGGCRRPWRTLERWFAFTRYLWHVTACSSRHVRALQHV